MENILEMIANDIVPDEVETIITFLRERVKETSVAWGTERAFEEEFPDPHTVWMWGIQWPWDPPYRFDHGGVEESNFTDRQGIS